MQLLVGRICRSLCHRRITEINLVSWDIDRCVATMIGVCTRLKMDRDGGGDTCFFFSLIPRPDASPCKWIYQL